MLLNKPFKITKSNPLQKAVVLTPPALTGGIFLYGRIGSGKSTGMISLAQKYHDHPDRKYKIFHVWGGDRTEQMYWCFPSRDLSYWQKVKRAMNLQNEGPKQYKVNILVPMTKGLRKKMPQKAPYINTKMFTIPISSVEMEDISLVIGSLGQVHEYSWREAKGKLKKKDNAAHLLKAFKDMNGTNNSLYKNFVLPLCRHRLLQDDNCSFNLDLIEETKDQDTVTVLCLDFLEKEYRLFVLGWILRQMSVLIDNGKVPTKNIFMIQEAAEFFRATDDSISPERNKIFRKMLAHYIRMGRRGMHLFMDAQSPAETKGMVDGSQDLTIFGKLVSEGDKEAGTKQLYRDSFITKRQIQDLSVLKPGEYYISETGKKVNKRYFLLPRTMYWKKGFGNFFDNVWKNLVNDWKDMTPMIDEVEENYQKAKEAIAQAERDEKNRKQMEKEMAEAKKEEEKNRREAIKAAEKAERMRNVMQERRAIKRADKLEKTDLEQTMDDIQEIEKEQSIKTVIDSNIQDEEDEDIWNVSPVPPTD